MIQQQKTKPRPRPKRTVGELVAAWLLLLWGIVTGTYFFPSSGVEIDLSGVLSILLISQGVACFLGGLAALLRLRKGTQALLTLAALCFLSFAGILLWLSKKYPEVPSYFLPIVASVLIALGFFFLGRWLGSQEDSDD